MSASNLRELPAGDLALMIRETAFAMLLTRRRPVAVVDVASALGTDDRSASATVDRLAEGGWVDRDAAGRLTGAAGLSLSHGAHRLRIGTAQFRTWCAYDAVGISAALGADATIGTECPVCGQEIDLRIVAGQPPTDRPERLWLAAGGDDLRGDFCDPTVMLCSARHALVWGRRFHGHGRAVGLAEAAALGAEAWGPAARRAMTLANGSDWARR